jgi:hypothetical protein
MPESVRARGVARGIRERLYARKGKTVAPLDHNSISFDGNLIRIRCYAVRGGFVLGRRIPAERSAPIREPGANSAP